LDGNWEDGWGWPAAGDPGSNQASSPLREKRHVPPTLRAGRRPQKHRDFLNGEKIIIHFCHAAS